MQRPTAPAAPACAALLVVLAGCAEPEDREPPAAPSGLTAQAGSATSVHVMWDRAEDCSDVAAYEVYRGGTRVTTLAAPRHMVDVDGLAPRTGYRFTVRARDAAGNLSPATAPVSVTTPEQTPDDHTPPTRPGAVRGALDGDRAAVLTWSPATDAGGVTAYDVYREDVRIHSVGGGATRARVTGLRPGTVYTFTVRARDAAENSSPDSEPVDLATPAGPDGGPSTAPTGLTASARPGRIDLRWTPPDTGAPVTEHQLHLNGRPATTIVWGTVPPGPEVGYTMTVTDPPGTRYSIKIRARLPDGGWGGFSAQRTVVVVG
ncbi:fibronectin type III domain-containing protein [Streptomyces sp. NPDC048001]|uniref:fibronectin type III domain-containing protein n=1 Tax=Streptomyces sp. NPDC048001 TaxID=3365498 RepID=UPI003721609C